MHSYFTTGHTVINIGIRAKYFSTRVTPNWNNLSADLVNSVSINHLKNALLREHHEKKLVYTIL